MDKTSILAICNAHEFVNVTFKKASGEITTRRTSFKAVPGELEGKGMRSFKDDQVNLFDAGKMGWITIKVANVTAVVPE
jgi:hypothetical protein